MLTHTHTHTHTHAHARACTHSVAKPTLLYALCCRFKHKNPEDPSEVPGGFLTDCNEVRCTASHDKEALYSLDSPSPPYAPPCLLLSSSPLPPFPSQDSLQVNSTALVDVTVRAAPHLTCYQFERVGYFCIDFDSSKERVRGRRPYACPQHNCELSLAFQLSLCGTCLTVFFSSFQLVFNKTIGLKEDSGKNIS